jgi:hypothetical protein
VIAITLAAVAAAAVGVDGQQSSQVAALINQL